MIRSLRKSASADSEPSAAPNFQTRFAQASNAVSWVTPRSRVMASYGVRPGDLRDVDGSPPSRCSTTSVVRRSAPILLTPATYLPSHFTLNLKSLYGSNLVGLTGNSAISTSQAPTLPSASRAKNELCDAADDAARSVAASP